MTWDEQFDAALLDWLDQTSERSIGCQGQGCAFCTLDRNSVLRLAMENHDVDWPQWMRCSFARIFLGLYASLDWEKLNRPWNGTTVRLACRRSSVSVTNPKLHQEAHAIAQEHRRSLETWFRYRISDVGGWPRGVLEGAGARPPAVILPHG